MKTLFKTLTGLFIIMLLATGIGSVTGFSPIAVFAGILSLSLFTTRQSGVLLAGVNKEIWLPEIMENFFPDASFLSKARNFDAFVENDKINLAEAGVSPDVLINNTTYPVPVEERNDTPISIELDYYDTKNTVIRNAGKVELAYDKLQSVTYGHKQALQSKFAQKAIHAYAPAADGTFTPVIGTSGATNGAGVKKISFEDILKLFKRFNEVDLPGDRVLVLHPEHESELMAEDLKLYKEVMNTQNLFGFKVFRFSKMPVFDKTTGAKKAFGAAAGANDTIASVAYLETEVMRALGTMDMFFKEKDPEARGDIIGFQMRGIALPIRGKGIAAIYSAS